MGDPNQASFDSAVQSVTELRTQADPFTYSSDSSYRDSSANYESAFNEPTPTRAGEDINPQGRNLKDFNIIIAVMDNIHTHHCVIYTVKPGVHHIRI